MNDHFRYILRAGIGIMLCIFLGLIFLVDFPLKSGDSAGTLRRYRRVTGGNQYGIEDMPYLVSLRYEKSHYCGGSILNNSVILTAASCIKPDVQKIKVRIGSNYFKKKGKTIRASKFIQHPEFNNETLTADVAIIILQEEMNYTQNIRRIIPASQEKKLPKPGQFVRIAGWGHYDPTAAINSSEEMRSVEIPVMRKETCKICYPDRNITESMFCGGYFLGGKGPSSGDIGGPVVYKGIQYGVVSFTGDSGAYPLSPAVFTSVPKVREFIQRYIKV